MFHLYDHCWLAFWKRIRLHLSLAKVLSPIVSHLVANRYCLSLARWVAGKRRCALSGGIWVALFLPFGACSWWAPGCPLPHSPCAPCALPPPPHLGEHVWSPVVRAPRTKSTLRFHVQWKICLPESASVSEGDFR